MAKTAAGTASMTARSSAALRAARSRVTRRARSDGAPPADLPGKPETHAHEQQHPRRAVAPVPRSGQPGLDEEKVDEKGTGNWPLRPLPGARRTSWPRRRPECAAGTAPGHPGSDRTRRAARWQAQPSECQWQHPRKGAARRSAADHAGRRNTKPPRARRAPSIVPRPGSNRKATAHRRSGGMTGRI